MDFPAQYTSVMSVLWNTPLAIFRLSDAAYFSPIHALYPSLFDINDDTNYAEDEVESRQRSSPNINPARSEPDLDLNPPSPTLTDGNYGSRERCDSIDDFWGRWPVVERLRQLSMTVADGERQRSESSETGFGDEQFENDEVGDVVNRTRFGDTSDVGDDADVAEHLGINEDRCIQGNLYESRNIPSDIQSADAADIAHRSLELNETKNTVDVFSSQERHLGRNNVVGINSQEHCGTCESSTGSQEHHDQTDRHFLANNYFAVSSVDSARESWSLECGTSFIDDVEFPDSVGIDG